MITPSEARGLAYVTLGDSIHREGDRRIKLELSRANLEQGGYSAVQISGAHRIGLLRRTPAA